MPDEKKPRFRRVSDTNFVSDDSSSQEARRSFLQAAASGALFPKPPLPQRAFIGPGPFYTWVPRYWWNKVFCFMDSVHLYYSLQDRKGRVATWHEALPTPGDLQLFYRDSVEVLRALKLCYETIRDGGGFERPFPLDFSYAAFLVGRIREDGLLPTRFALHDTSCNFLQEPEEVIIEAMKKMEVWKCPTSSGL